MSRVAYREPLSRVGFRPVYPTDPFQASHRGGLSGMGTIGAIDSATMESIGFSPAQIAQITAAHNDGSLSDNGYLFLLQGGVPVGDLANFLAQDPGVTAAGSTAASGTAAGVPGGSTIAYQGVWTTSTNTNARNPAAILQALSPLLPAHGLSLSSSSVTNEASVLDRALGTDTPFTVNLVLRVTGQGFATPEDAASIVEHFVYQITGNMPQSGVATAVSPGGSSGAAATSFTQWIEQNVGTIFLGLAAVFVLPALVKKL